MICRNLVQNPLTKKQNIVWFGSYGKNNNYSLATFVEPPSAEVWEAFYQNYYIITFIHKNLSPVWSMVYKKAGNEYIPVTQMPDDWFTNWMDYWIINFEQNNSNLFDPSQQYYLHGNKLSADNYSKEQKGVANSLIQRLSVIKGELWYKASYGLPLMEKIKNKGIYDSIIINIITTHPEVVNLISIESKIENRKYMLDFVVYTIYNNELRIQYTI